MFSELSPTLIAAAVVGGYLLGSIPFGVLVMRAAGAGDPRAIGSGNIGATNVLRSGKKGLAALTLLGDGGKGALAVLFAWLATRHASTAAQGTLTALAGGAAFFGHLFPVWLGFKGGKGVATFFGTLLAAAWPVGLIAGATWLGMAAVFRRSRRCCCTGRRRPGSRW
jgi:glycerol-3-phosphate acyltransferase PlsY